MNKQINIEAVTNHMLETIEMLKNNSLKKADPHEKIDIDTAKVIAELGTVAIEAFKVQAQVLNILSKADNPSSVITNSLNMGILPQNKKEE